MRGLGWIKREIRTSLDHVWKNLTSNFQKQMKLKVVFMKFLKLLKECF